MDRGTHRAGAENADRHLRRQSVDAFDFIYNFVQRQRRIFHRAVFIAVALLPDTRGKQLALYG